MRFRDIILAHNIDSCDPTNSESGKKRTEDVQISENVGFSDMMIAEDILAGLKKSGFKKPSPIQLKAIPIAKLGFGNKLTTTPYYCTVVGEESILT